MIIPGASFTVDSNGVKAAEAKQSAEEVRVFSKNFEKKLNDSLFSRPTVFYGTKPTNAQVGDIFWDVASQGDITSNATPYRFDGARWNPVTDSVTNLFGTNIYGVNVYGADINGGTFSSAKKDANNFPYFSVDTNGNVVGNNFSMSFGDENNPSYDLGHDQKSFVGKWDRDSTKRLGFNLDHGLMHFNAQVTPLSTGNTYNGETYIEPDRIKFRHRNPDLAGDSDGGKIIYRTDISSSRIQTSTGWGDNTGAMLFADGGVIGDYGTFRNDINMQGRLHTQNLTISSGSVIGTKSGAVYFENGNGDSGGGGADVHAASFAKMSQLSVKRNVSDITGEHALAQILGTEIKRYDYIDIDNNQKSNIGPIIDDIRETGKKQYRISDEIINKQCDGVSIDNEVGLLIASVQELSKRNTELQLRLTKLERGL